MILSDCASAADAVATPAASTPTPPVVTEQEITRTVQRIQYLADAEVIRRGLKHLEKLVDLEIDLSWRADLRQALLAVAMIDPQVVKKVSYDLRLKAGELIGKTRILNAVSSEVIQLLKGNVPPVGEAAIREFVVSTHSIPNFDLMTAVRDLKKWELMREIAVQTGDPQTISMLIDEVRAEQRYDLVYGVDNSSAAELVVKHMLEQFDAPLAPSELKAVVTTYHSIQLSWKDNSLSEEGYEIERSEDHQNFTLLAKLPSNQIYYSDTGLVSGKTYDYRLKAVNAIKKDSEVMSVSAEIPAEPAPPPEPVPAPLPTVPADPAPAPAAPAEPTPAPAAPTPAPTAPLFPKDPPALPSSPAPSVSFDELIPRVLLVVQGKPHAPSIDALLKVVKSMSTTRALAAANLLAKDFTRAAFDSQPEVTSLGLQSVIEMKARAERELINFQFSDANMRRGNADQFKKSARELESRFSEDLP